MNQQISFKPAAVKQRRAHTLKRLKVFEKNSTYSGQRQTAQSNVPILRPVKTRADGLDAHVFFVLLHPEVHGVGPVVPSDFSLYPGGLVFHELGLFLLLH